MAREIRSVNERYTELDERLIASGPALADLRSPDVGMLFLESGKAKQAHGKMVLGECERVA